MENIWETFFFLHFPLDKPNRLGYILFKFHQPSHQEETMLLYDVFYAGTHSFDANIPLPPKGQKKGDRAVCKNGPSQTLIWNGRKWADEAAADLGRRGGSTTSEAKKAAAQKNGAEGGRPRQVVTWQAPNGQTIDICRKCEASLDGRWPKNSRGEEFCTVSHGLHSGSCDICTKRHHA